MGYKHVGEHVWFVIANDLAASHFFYAVGCISHIVSPYYMSLADIMIDLPHACIRISNLMVDNSADTADSIIF